MVKRIFITFTVAVASLLVLLLCGLASISIIIIHPPTTCSKVTDTDSNLLIKDVKQLGGSNIELCTRPTFRDADNSYVSADITESLISSQCLTSTNVVPAGTTSFGFPKDLTNPKVLLQINKPPDSNCPTRHFAYAVEGISHGQLKLFLVSQIE